jgi:trimeric autotransporter adhesin
MKKFSLVVYLLLFIASLQSFAQTNIVAGRMNEVFLKTDLSSANALNDPWEITYGPDDSLWITESKGYAVYKMHPNGGAKRKILDISLKSVWLGNTPASDSVFNLQFVFSPTNPQGGLAGLAIHPDYNAGVPKKYVYVSYIRSYLSTAPSNGGVFFQNRIVRFTFNTATGRLDSPVSLCDTLPGSSDHNSQRLIIAPVNGVDYLFYGAGDMGAGQFSNQNRQNNAQNSSIYEGKILRFNLEPDGDAGSLDKWIPNDNPFNGAKQSAVWAIGIRNNQGFAYDSVRGILYGSSHGPYSDDEVNIIQPAKNYGHPLVIGYAADNNYNGSSAGSYPSSSLPVIVSETGNAAAIGASYKDPIFSGYPTTQAAINNIWTTQPSNSGWPSEGWSGLGLYNNSMIPDWKNSLLMSGLKWGRLIRTRLNAAGTAVVPTNGTDTVCYFDSNNRYRDIAFGPGGKDIFVIMDKSAATSGPSANNPGLIACAGCLQKYTFLGYNASGGTSTIPSSVTIAAGKPNMCENANTITINANNASLWVPITDTSSNVVAEINANGNILGNVTTAMYTNNGPVREDLVTKTLYLDRNITITPAVQPSTPVSIRLYLTTAEFTALKNATNSVGQPSSVNIIGDLSIYKNSDPCLSDISATPTRIVTTHQAAFGAGGYVVQGDISSFSSFYLANEVSILSVRLVSFTGSLINDIAQLRWVTEDENSTKTFTVERSSDGRVFTAIAGMAAAANTGKITYTYADSAVTRQSSALVYYRLKLTDVNGRFSYSAIIKLNLTKVNRLINIRPNPVVDQAVVEINAVITENTYWTLADITGKTVLKKSIGLVKGDNSITLNLGKLPAGIYYLKVSGNNINQSVKLQKL